jgi:hypothetical protein
VALLAVKGRHTMTFLRKHAAGADSFGNTWPEDGAVIEVDAEQAAVLLSIPDAGFSEVAEPEQISEAPQPEPTPAKPVPAKTPAAPRGRTVKE